MILQSERLRPASAYAAGLESMADLCSSMQGFALGDEYNSLWKLINLSGLPFGEALELMRERITANLLTYSQEKDSRHFELQYIFGLGGERDFTTRDHAAFSGLTDMSLAGAKKARERVFLPVVTQQEQMLRNAYAEREYQALLGVRRLRDLMVRAEVGDRIALIYPPLPDGTASIVYVYSVVGKQGEEMFVNVAGEVVDFSRVGAEVLRGWLYASEEQRFIHSGIDAKETPAEASPFFTARSAEDIFAAAALVAQQPAYFSGKVTEERTQKGNEAYYEQISQAGDFITRVLGETYSAVYGRALTQEALEDLELAFSFARSSVLIQTDENVLVPVVSSDSLYADFHDREELRRGNPTEEEVNEYNQRIAARYGYLGIREEASVGCPAAVLAALGLGGGFGRDGGVPNAMGTGECVAISCTACGCKDIPENATQCPVCGWAPGKSVQEYRRKIQEQQKTSSNEHAVKPRLAFVADKPKNKERGPKREKDGKKKAA